MSKFLKRRINTLLYFAVYFLGTLIYIKKKEYYLPKLWQNLFISDIKQIAYCKAIKEKNIYLVKKIIFLK